MQDDFAPLFYFHTHSQNSLSKRKFKPYFASLLTASILGLTTFNSNLIAADWALDTRSPANATGTTQLSTDTTNNKTTINQPSGANTDIRLYNSAWSGNTTHNLSDLEIASDVILNMNNSNDAQNYSIYLSNAATTIVGSITNNGDIQSILTGANSTITNFTNTGTITGNSRWAAFDSYSFSTNANLKNTITNFTNSGTIKVENGNSHAVSLRFSDMTNFTNSGTISSANGRGVHIQSSAIENFTNSGTITASGSGSAGVYSQGGTTTNFTNTGTISGGRYGVHIFTGSNYTSTSQKLVSNFVNEGLIEATTYRNSTLPSTYSYSAAVFIQTSGIDSFENKGTLKSTSTGIILAGNQHSQVGTIKNSGNIELSGDGWTSGIFTTSFLNNYQIQSIENTGSITGGKYGVVIETGEINELKNSGTIEASEIALNFVTNGGASDGHIGTLTIASGGVMKGGKDGIDLRGNSANSTIDHIIIEDGGLLEGTTGSALIIGDGNRENYKFNGDIQVDGTLKGGASAIENNSIIGGNITIGSTGQIDGGIVNQGEIANIGGTITNNSNSSLVITNTNQATITGSITNAGGGSVSIDNKDGAKLDSSIINNGSGNVNINNQGNAVIEGDFHNNSTGNMNISNTGKVGDTTIVENNGAGSTNISNWLVSSNSNGQVKPLEITGSNLGNIKVDNIIFDVGNLGNLNDIVADTDNFIIIDTSKDTSVNNPAEVSNRIFGNINFSTNDSSVNVNVNSGRLTFSIDASKTTAAVLGKTLISNTRARNTFITSAMNNVMKTTNLLHYKNNIKNSRELAIGGYEVGALYASNDMIQSDILTRASYKADKEGVFFVLPYFSYSKTELSAGLETKGHTLGTILGYSFYNSKNDDIWGIYAGYDEFDASSPFVNAGGIQVNGVELKSRTYFAGLEYYKTLTRIKDNPVYIRGSSQLAMIKNDISEILVTNDPLKTEPKSYAYGLGAHLGTHFVLNEKNVLSPEIGLAYEGGFTRAFTLTNGNHYSDRKNFVHKTNFYKTTAGVSYFRDWHKYFKSVVDVGVEYTLNPKVDNPNGYIGDLRYGGGKTRLDDTTGYVGVNFAFPLEKEFYFTINYNANFAEETTMHTGYMKFSYVW